MNETSAKFRSVTLRVWRQPGPGQPGRFVEYKAEKLNPTCPSWRCSMW